MGGGRSRVAGLLFGMRGGDGGVVGGRAIPVGGLRATAAVSTSLHFAQHDSALLRRILD